MKDLVQPGVSGVGRLPSRKGLAVLIPAYNEHASLPALLAEVRRVLPETDIILVSDGSADATARVAREGGGHEDRVARIMLLVDERRQAREIIGIEAGEERDVLEEVHDLARASVRRRRGHGRCVSKVAGRYLR